EDEGPGLPEGAEDKVFKRFYSERPDSEEFGSHSGLGLAICRQVIEAHGGRISAENRINEEGDIEGAIFTVRLPLVS
ncbi:MAG: ATP-binding protein, partial [Sneathiellales bacterium]|nr:ATP-binding protein [Sneathiellales bacterium]